MLGSADFGVASTVPIVVARRRCGDARRAAAAGERAAERKQQARRPESRRFAASPPRPIRAPRCAARSSACARSSARRSSCCRASPSTATGRPSSAPRSPAARRCRAATRSPSHAWFARYARVRDPLARLASCLRRRGGARHGRAAGAVRRATAVRQQRAVGGSSAAAGQAIPPERSRWSCRPTATLDFAQPLRGLLDRRMDRGRPEPRGNHRDHLPVQPARLLRAADVLLAVPPVPGEDWTVARCTAC